jgi:acyl-CoA thioesterase FadM
METVVIDSVLLQLGATDLLVEMRMWNERKDKLKSVMCTNLVHINIKTQKPQNHSQYLLGTF